MWQSVYGDHMLEIWRNVAEYLWRSYIGVRCLELDDRKWRLNHNGEIMETNYGNQNFIHHGGENTYLERFKDKNV